MSPTHDLTVIGNTNLDVLVGQTDRLPDPGTEVVVGDIGVRLGGSAGNFAVRAAQLGVRTRLVSRIGDDAVARLLRAELDRPGLTAELIETPTRATPVTVAVEAPGRDRAFLSSVGAMDALAAADVDESWLATRYVALNGSFLLPGLDGGGGVKLLECAAAHGAVTLLDTGWPPSGWTAATRSEVMELLSATHVFLPNDDEVRGITGEDDPSAGAARLADETASIVVLKRGSRGAELHRPGEDAVIVEVEPATVVDSTGAGDSFGAAYVAALDRGCGPEEATRTAVAFAARFVACGTTERDGLTLSPFALS